MVFGKLGLLVVGVVIGAVGHASLSLKQSASSPLLEGLRKQVERLEKEREEAKDAVSALLGREKEGRHADFKGVPPETGRALEELTEATVKEYVRYVHSRGERVGERGWG